MRRFGIILLTLLSMTKTGLEAVERSQVPEKYRWNLADLYASEQAWRDARGAVAARFREMESFRGHLGDSSELLERALDTMFGIDKEVSRIRTYATQSYDQDTRVSAGLEMQQSAELLANEYRAAVAYVRPEILGLGSARVKQLVASHPGLGVYAHFLDDILRVEVHTLSQNEELVIAQAGQLAAAPESIHTVLANADLPYPEVVLTTGEKVRLDPSAYAKHRGSAVRADRDQVFEAFWEAYDRFRRTFGVALYAQVNAHIFTKNARKYGSCLEASLDRNSIPTDVYRHLIADVRASLPTLHRYLNLRRRMLNVDVLRYEDLYAPVVKEAELTYTPEQAIQMTLDAFAPLGKDYVDSLKTGYDSRWVDFLPNDGKKSGAYSNGTAYDVHPYQLLNFNGSYYDVSILAHESGHSVHAYLACKQQPYQYSDSAIFVAEVASTVNEHLLVRHMLDRTKDEGTRLFLLGQYLDNFRFVIFRQAMFAEFELKIHEMAERGETLTGDVLNRTYLELLRAYCGHEAGVCKVDERYAVEWAYIPHFYYDFYVYQYATSMVASTALAKGIMEEAKRSPATTARRDAYLTMLSAGSSDYPIDLLRRAGVDLTTSAPFQAAMLEMNHVMDEIETILSRK
ncbi:MAG: oligoendopeptidase F [Acidobacteria bacterium]|nr:oligoendopeptidase F [Acidobacteriota bacterium]